MTFSGENHTLPPELIDQIIDHLHDDVLALRACCLVSHYWVPSTRFHIFHDVVLSAEHAKPFATLLKISPHISPFVRCLNIRGYPSQIYRKSDYLDTVVPIIAPKLTRLKTLRIESVTLAPHQNALSALIHNLSTVQSLSISSVTFSRFRDFAALVVAHPFLECLDLGQIWWTELAQAHSHWEGVFQAYPELRSGLRSISLADTSDDVLDWILSHYRVLPVRTLIHSAIMTGRIPHMTKALRSLGPSLEHLAFSVYSPPSSKQQDLSDTPIISSNTSLRTLTFDRLFLLHRSPQLYAWVPALLSQVTSPYIEEITFILVWTQLNLIEALDLERIQEIVTTRIFSGLKRVVFRLVGDLDPYEARREILGRMDKLAKRELLIFRREP